MQFIWISGPVGRIRSVELSNKKLLVLASLLFAAAFLIITSVNLWGARALFSVSPKLVQKLGGLVTAAEQQAREAEFDREVSRIRLALKETERELQKAEEFKNRLQNLLSRDSRDHQPRSEPSGRSRGAGLVDQSSLGRGGPFIPASTRGSLAQDAAGVVFAPIESAVGPVGPEVRQLSKRAQQLRTGADTLSQAWSSDFDLLSAMPLAVPVDHKRPDTDFSSAFGFRRDPFNGQMAFHGGVDFSAPPGTPVYATADGIVVEVSNSPGGYGRSVLIEHPSGFFTLYAHLSSVRVRQGDRLKRHTVIGGIGSTGRSTGPHLHYEVLSKSKSPINPKYFLSVLEN